MLPRYQCLADSGAFPFLVSFFTMSVACSLPLNHVAIYITLYKRDDKNISLLLTI